MIALSDGTARLAAKFGPADADGISYHPLACHLADVAAVALAMWQERLATRQRMQLAEGFGLSEAQAGRWVGFLAGLHDLGKACPAFQRKDGNAAHRLQGLLPISTAFPGREPGHGSVSGHAVAALLQDRHALTKPQASKLGLILAGHHGLFPLDIREAHGVRIGEPPGAVAQWDSARAELFDVLARILGIEDSPSGVLSNAQSMVLAGIISVTDWIGSNQECFAWRPSGTSDLESYFRTTRGIAVRALDRIHWRSVQEPGEPAAFERLFGKAPRPLQRVASELRGRADAPGLVIVEAPMGEGKTEAALLLVDYWNARGFQGAYVALPTQATANQLHGRVARFLQRRFQEELQAQHDVNLLLVHGGTIFQDVEYLPTGVDDEAGPRVGAVAAGEWFLPRKRALLAPYGVGTVDQSLMAVLQVKHVFVRLFGLAGKAVVIDEVHAYDTYMSGLLERLLEWLAALGSPVVLLSATLPTTKRQALIEAYARGLTAGAQPTAGTPECAYPRVTWLEGGRPEAEHFPAAERSNRTLGLAHIDDSPDAVRALLERELARGGCAAVICNTVARAQETYLELRKSFPANELGLFHARFLMKDRMAREQDCLERFGPPADDGTCPGRPPRYILVATQVIEQSLDIDFDVLISDLAPIDLLLQRSGRLQRHDRGPRLQPLRLWIRWPEEQDGCPRLDRASTFVYDAHILLRTWHRLRERSRVAIPRDVQNFIDWVYGGDECLPDELPQPVQVMWRATWDKMTQRMSTLGAIARQPRIAEPWFDEDDFLTLPNVGLLQDAPGAASSRRAATRYEEQPSVDVVILPFDVPADIDRRSVIRTRELLLHSVQLRGAWTPSFAEAVGCPGSWRDSPALRHFRLLRVSGRETDWSGTPQILVDDELGVVINHARTEEATDGDW